MFGMIIIGSSLIPSLGNDKITSINDTVKDCGYSTDNMRTAVLQARGTWDSILYVKMFFEVAFVAGIIIMILGVRKK